MKKVAQQIMTVVSMLACVFMVTACSSGSSNNNNVTCNAYGQCYNTSTCGTTGAYPYGTTGAYPYGSTYPYTTGAYPYGSTSPYGTAYNPTCSSLTGPGFTNYTGMPYQFTPGQFATGGVCGGYALPIVDPMTGVTQCAPLGAYNSFASYGAMPGYFPGYYNGFGGGFGAGAFLYIN